MNAWSSRTGDDRSAEAEFRREIAVDPDLADTYDQLGALYARTEKDQETEHAYREALARDAKMPSAYEGLAKL